MGSRNALVPEAEGFVDLLGVEVLQAGDDHVLAVVDEIPLITGGEQADWPSFNGRLAAARL